MPLFVLQLMAALAKQFCKAEKIVKLSLYASLIHAVVGYKSEVRCF